MFPALELRKVFSRDDVRYLGNLCHDCRACQQACMYTEPHEFALNIPKIMSEVRLESYEHWSWPTFLGKSFSSTSIGILLGCFAAVIVCIAAFLSIPASRLGAIHRGPAAFYRIVPYLAMVVPAAALFLYGAIIWFQGGIRFWTESESPLLSRPSGFAPIFRAIRDSLTLKYLGGSGSGCYYPGESPSSVRRVFHSFVFWGIILDFLSTTLAFVYQDIVHMQPPYSYGSAPVILGTLGGLGLIIGCPGLIYLKYKSNPAQSAAKAYGLDYTFLIFLTLTSLTGLLTLLLRTTSALGPALVIHLAMVAALFLTAPYGKFVHFIYRSFAVIRYQIEAEGARLRS